MAVISCPGCKKKISDKAKVCSHCQLDLQGLDADKMSTLKKIDRINKAQRLMNYSFIAMILFCGGFFMMYFDNVEPGSLRHNIAIGCAAIGFIMYIVIRVMLLFTKRKSN